MGKIVGCRKIQGVLGAAVISALIISLCVRGATAAPAPPKPTGELRLARSALGEVLDPSLFAPGETKYHLNLLYDYLVGATADAKLSKDHGLARNWEVKQYKTHSTYTFHLRNGIRFHDGVEVTAEDVKFSLEYFTRPAAKTPYTALLKKNIGEIKVIDRYTIEVRTTAPYSLLLADLSPLVACEGMVLPKHYIQKYGDKNFSKKPIGSGPYKFKEQMVGSYITYEAVEYKHWLYGIPKYERVTFRLVPEESTRLAMIRTGEVDIAEISREKVPELKAAGFKPFFKEGSEIVTMRLNNTWEEDSYLHDVRVREALSLAINREALVKNIFMGSAKIVGHGTYYGSWAYGYHPVPLHTYDPVRAKGLLKETMEKHGWNKLSLTLNSFKRPGVEEMMLMNEAIASMWKKVFGDLIDLKIVPIDYSTHRSKWIKGTLSNTLFGMNVGNRPFYPSLWFGLFHSKGVLRLIKDPQLDTMIEKTAAELDMAKLGQGQFETAKYMRDAFYELPLFEVDASFVAKPDKVKKWNLGFLIYDLNILSLVTQE